MAKHRPKAEIEAEKLAKAQRLADRMAMRAEKNAEAQRRRKAKVAAETKRRRAQRLLATALEKRTAAQEAAYQAEIAAIQFETKERKSKLRDLERWWPAPVRWPGSNLVHGGLGGHG